jgi:hypothetical protein
MLNPIPTAGLMLERLVMEVAQTPLMQDIMAVVSASMRDIATAHAANLAAFSRMKKRANSFKAAVKISPIKLANNGIKTPSVVEGQSPSRREEKAPYGSISLGNMFGGFMPLSHVPDRYLS